MNIVFFGATGPAGRLTLTKLLAAGHVVTVYARQPARLGIEHEHLIAVRGELTDAALINQIMTGADAVISLLGPNRRSRGTPIAQGMRVIVRAMQAHGVRRIIATATPSAIDPQDRPQLAFTLAVGAVKLLAGSAHQEITETANAIRTTRLDWTVLRLPMLSDRPNDRPVAIGYIGDPQIKLLGMSRERLADFVVGQLDDRRWIMKSPMVCNG
jgi:nucleoside-diphosphate-sugar epimerase